MCSLSILCASSLSVILSISCLCSPSFLIISLFIVFPPSLSFILSLLRLFSPSRSHHPSSPYEISLYISFSVSLVELQHLSQQTFQTNKPTGKSWMKTPTLSRCFFWMLHLLGVQACPFLQIYEDIYGPASGPLKFRRLQYKSII